MTNLQRDVTNMADFHVCRNDEVWSDEELCRLFRADPPVKEHGTWYDHPYSLFRFELISLAAAEMLVGRELEKGECVPLYVTHVLSETQPQ